MVLPAVMAVGPTDRTPNQAVEAVVLLVPAALGRVRSKAEKAVEAAGRVASASAAARETAAEPYSTQTTVCPASIAAVPQVMTITPMVTTPHVKAAAAVVDGTRSFPVAMAAKGT